MEARTQRADEGTGINNLLDGRPATYYSGRPLQWAYNARRQGFDVKQSLGIPVLAALLAVRLAYGATNATQQVQTVNFTLTATVQTGSTAAGSSCTNASLATKDVIAALGQAVGKSFSSSAQLVLIANSTNSIFYVRDGGYTLVNGNLRMDTLGAVTKTTASKSGQTTGSQYEVGVVRIETPALNMSLYGYGAQTLGTGAFTASGFGAGTVGANQNQAIFKGTVAFSAVKAQ
jgi:hypothetical protein